MEEDRYDFYLKMVQRFIRADASVLVVAGTELDASVFRQRGCAQVTVSNLDACVPAGFEDYTWERQNAHELTYADDSFDYVVIHAGLHHCRSPHRALLEMYRVARLGVLAMESKDCLVFRVLKRFSLTQHYETAAVYHNDCERGGVDNTSVPNLVYRWTEAEVIKTIAANAPEFPPRVEFAYGLAEPCTPKLQKGGWRSKAMALAMPLYRMFLLLFPKERNQLAFFVQKPMGRQAHPWLQMHGKSWVFNRQWGEERYTKQWQDFTLR